MSEIIAHRNRLAYAVHQRVTRRVAELIQQRAELEEEVRQLRAAVQIWTAVAEQTSGTDRSRQPALTLRG